MISSGVVASCGELTIPWPEDTARTTLARVFLHTFNINKKYCIFPAKLMDQRVIIKQTLSLYINLLSHFASMKHLLEKANPFSCNFKCKARGELGQQYKSKTLERNNGIKRNKDKLSMLSQY